MNFNQFQVLVSLPPNTSKGGHIYYEYHDTIIADELVAFGLAVGETSQHSHTHLCYRRTQRGDLLVAELLAHANKLMREINNG